MVQTIFIVQYLWLFYNYILALISYHNFCANDEYDFYIFGAHVMNLYYTSCTRLSYAHVIICYYRNIML